MRRLVCRLVALAGLLLPAAAWAAPPRALLVYGFGSPNEPVAAGNVRGFLLGRGFSVDESPFVPADLSAYCCVWDLRPFDPLTSAEKSSYASFLQKGHGLFLCGENLGCCQARNASLEDFIGGWAGGGSVAAGTQRPNTFSETANPGHPATNVPRNVNLVTYDGVAAGTWTQVGRGEILTSDVPLSQTAAAWNEGDLLNAPDGRIVSVLDINWLVDTFGATDNPEFVEDVSHWLCPTTAGGLTVTITSPSGFTLECPAQVTVQGVVDGSASGCEQATSLAPLAPAVPAPADAETPVPAADGGDRFVPLAVSPDSFALAGSVAAPPLVRHDPALAALSITSIRVRVNGGPFQNVTSTSPGLPAPPPVSFTAVSLPLVLGTNTIVVEARDDPGNSAQDQVSGLVRDTTPPVIDPATCQDVVVDLGPGCRLDYSGVPVATDSCDPLVDITASPPLPIVFTGPGTAGVAYEARDDAGNKATCSRTVTAQDISGPVLTCAPPATVECKAQGGTPASDPAIQAWLAATTAADNCSLASLSHDAPAFFPSGCPPGLPTTVTWTAEDQSQNSSSCSSPLSVQDSAPPFFTSTPGPLSLECNSPGGVPVTDPAVQAFLAAFSGQDLCAPAVTGSHDAPAVIPAGCSPGLATLVTYTLEDDCGNAATAAQSISVVDLKPPVLSVPPPLVLECSAPGGVPLSDPTVQAWLASAVATDLCGTASVGHDAPALLPSGCGAGQTTTVTFTASDGCNLTTSLTSTITVKDTTPPLVTPPAPLTLECNGPGGVSLSDPQVQAWLASAAASDVCGASTLADDAPALFASGCGAGLTTTVTFTGTDACNNSASAPSTVTVRDTTAPQLTVPADLTLECNGAGGVPASDPQVQAWLASASATDLCDGATIANDAPALLPAGCGPGTTTTITFTASDGCGNLVAKTAKITVRDTTPPVLSAPAPLVLECNGPGGVALSDPQVQAWLASAATSDVCGASTLVNDAPALFPSGCGAGTNTVVTFEATDGCGLKTTETSTLTVRDTTAPALAAPAPLVLECNGPGGILASDPQIQAWLASATASDVCDGATIQNDAPAFFPSACGAGLATPVKFSATDDCGNFVEQTVTVTVKDTTAPALSVPPPLVLECNAPGGVPLSDPQVQAWLASATASDVCDGATVVNDAPALFPSGCGAGFTTVVEFTASDDCGNVVTLASTVTVRDTTAPALSVPSPLVLECNAPGGVPLSDPQVQAWLASATASDVCDGATIAHDAPALFPSGCTPGTTTVVTFTATDICGNAAGNASTVTVQDTTPPVIGEVGFDGLCLWPPNHDFYCIDDVTAEVEASDVCDPDAPEIAVLGCRSSQPEDATGDGAFAPDCVILPSGKGVCVRSERQGEVPEGRAYTIEIGAKDGCDNSASREVTIRVPHDRSPKLDCARPNRGKRP